MDSSLGRPFKVRVVFSTDEPDADTRILPAELKDYAEVVETAAACLVRAGANRVVDELDLTDEERFAVKQRLGRSRLASSSAAPVTGIVLGSLTTELLVQPDLITIAVFAVTRGVVRGHADAGWGDPALHKRLTGFFEGAFASATNIVENALAASTARRPSEVRVREVRAIGSHESPDGLEIIVVRSQGRARDDLHDARERLRDILERPSLLDDE
jgi:hypothetical protein